MFIYARAIRMPPRDFASRENRCGGNYVVLNSFISLRIFNKVENPARHSFDSISS